MLELGGNVLGFSDASTSSVTKGESLADTIMTINKFADIIAMRHPKDGAPLVASRVTDIPIINGGDGSHCHPTQTLADLLTIKREMRRLDNLVIGMCGDLKFGRTVHSLTKAMMRYDNIRFVMISPDELRMPEHVLEEPARGGYSLHRGAGYGERDAGARHPLHDARAAGAFRRPGRVRGAEGYLYPRCGEDEASPRRTWPYCTRCPA